MLPTCAPISELPSDIHHDEFYTRWIFICIKPCFLNQDDFQIQIKLPDDFLLSKIQFCTLNYTIYSIFAVTILFFYFKYIKNKLKDH